MFVMNVGPPEQAMWALGENLKWRFSFFHCWITYLGDKIASTIIAQSAEVPTLPWSGSRNYNEFDYFFRIHFRFLDLKLEWSEDDRENANVPMDMYERACVSDAKQGVEVKWSRSFRLRKYYF
jgi:hypothetical protein